MTELKPCPFCGSTNIGLYHTPDGRGFWISDLFCNHCYASIKRHSNAQDDKIVAEAWNHRPNPWHKGEPAEDGWYDVVYKCIIEGKQYGKTEYRTMHIFTDETGWRDIRGGIQKNDIWKPVAYREIEPYSEED